METARTYLNSITVDISGAKNNTILVLGGYDISGIEMDDKIHKLLADPKYNICDGERAIVGEGNINQE